MKIIAESASNHQGNYDYLVELAKAAADAGADYFTAQVLEPTAFCDETYSSLQVVKDVSFDQATWCIFFNECKTININFIPCPADSLSLEFCLNEGFALIKLHGTDLLNIPMLEKIAKADVKVLVETQLATERDINLALQIIGTDKVEALFHGYSNYPSEEEELNLGALNDMREKWGLPLGFADHTTDTTEVPLMVMAIGCEWIEKHITLSRNHRRYDWQPSLNPNEFSIMVSQIRLYSKAMGSGIKHPSVTECSMRDVMYKRYIKGEKGLNVIRADHGPNYYEHLYEQYDSDRIVTTVIARLKSTRLKRKVLHKFRNDSMIFDLMKYVGKSQSVSKTVLATSYLDLDQDLVDEANNRDVNVYRGHPMIVIDRLLDVAEKERAGAIFRITGDMPFADPVLMDRMAELRREHNLDFVRVMNFPLGMSAELYSTAYLQKLYQKMENPHQSEYLGWFVLLDKEARKGCVKVEFNDQDLSAYSLTVDYQEDLDRCHALMDIIGKADITDITLEDILANLNQLSKVDTEMEIKLPGGQRMKYSEFVDMQWNQGFNIVEPFKVEL